MSITDLNKAFTLAFVISSMFGLGLSVTLDELVKPLKKGRLVAAVLILNFVVIPGSAWLLSWLLSLEASLAIGLIIISVEGAVILKIYSGPSKFGKGRAGSWPKDLRRSGAEVFNPIFVG